MQEGGPINREGVNLDESKEMLQAEVEQWVNDG